LFVVVNLGRLAQDQTNKSNQTPPLPLETRLTSKHLSRNSLRSPNIQTINLLWSVTLPTHPIAAIALTRFPGLLTSPRDQASGVGVTTLSTTTFQSLYMGKPAEGKSEIPRWIIFYINGELQVDVLEVGTKDNYDEFTKKFPENECRYAVYDFEYKKEGLRKDIIFFAW
jgi:hypothetical protein